MGATQQALAGTAPSTAENAKTTAWVAAVVTAGGTVSSGRRTLVNTLFDALDSNSLTAKLNRLWLTAAENAQSASVDLINLQTYTLSNAPTFTADRGYTFNGTNQGILLNSANAGTQNSSAFGFYLLTDSANRDQVQMGTSISGAAPDFNCAVSVAWSDGNLYFSLNDGNGDTGRAAPGTRSGIYVNSRTGSTTSTIYRAGASFATNGQTSSAVASFSYVLGGALDAAGGPNYFSNGQFGMAFLGAAGFSGTDVTNFTTAIQTYMTAVGA